MEHKREGFELCFLYLRNIKGYNWSHKHVYRIYKELELSLVNEFYTLFNTHIKNNDMGIPLL